MKDQPAYADTLRDEDERKSSGRVLTAIKKAERDMLAWHDDCDEIDKVYSRRDENLSDWTDPDYDLFWSSMEILKPAVYAHPPQPVVTPKFRDRDPVKQVAAEMLERAQSTALERGGIDEVMLCVRDDLIFYNRGQVWVTYEADEAGGGQRLCYEHLDRKDFGHEPARKWADVGFVYRRAWMTPKEMEKRFSSKSGDAYKDAKPAKRISGTDNDAEGLDGKCPVYEVWHKRDDRVYWVAEGVGVLLDESKPHLKLRGFYPCPRPAYGTMRPRTLQPVPDFLRYRSHFSKIDRLTKRIYLLLDKVKLKAFIPAGGEVGDAIEAALQNDSDDLVIPVPAAALMATGGSTMVTLPLGEIATAIQGLIEARGQLIEDFYQLSGISDIMRGATEAQETLGAQKLKSQYGSIRVREKVDELQRIARDVTEISAEIMSEHFSKDTMLEMSQMVIPTKAEIDKDIKRIEKEAEQALNGLKQQVQSAPDAKEQFDQQAQQIAAQFAPQLKEAESKVPVEAVMDLLKDDKARSFAFEIATDSTILTDEQSEKESRAEFLTAFMGMGAQLMEMAQLGPAGANLAGELLRFAIAPYRAGRQLDSVIDEFIDAAPQMASQAAEGEGEDEGLAAAQMKLAEAEVQKAQAAIAKVQADTQKAQLEIQLKQAEAQTKAQADQQRIGLEFEQTRGSIGETEARIRLVEAQIAKMGVDASNQTRKEDREDVKAAADIQGQQQDRAMAAQDQQRQAFESDRDAAMGARQQQNDNQRAERGEQRADRQQSFAEKQAQQEAKRDG